MDYLKFEADKESRADLARLLNGVGRGVSARLDIPLVTLNDLKWFVHMVKETMPALEALAYQDQREEVYRVIAARSQLDTLKANLQRKNRRAESLSLQKKNRENPYYR